MRSDVKTFDYIRERKRLRKKTPLLLITAFLFTSFISQISPQSTDIMIEQIFLDQGLSQSIVKCICQDSEGFMFFGTEDGLNKYDGYKFSVIKHNPRDSNSISYNDITALLASRSGMIWIGTFNAGLNRYDQISGSLLRIQHNPADPNTLSHDNITAIIEDGAGNLWVGTENGLNMLTLVDSSKSIYKVTRFRNDPNDAGSLSGNHVLSLLEDKTGYIWIGTDDGLNKMTPPSGSAERSGLMRFKNSRRDSRSLSGDIVRAIFQDSGGSIWIGTDNGLNRIEKDKNGREIFIRYNDVSGMGINDIYAISEDKKGNMWIGTNGGGIILLNKKNGEFVTYSYDSQNPGSLSYNEIRSLFRDRSGIMWIGTYGGGICKVSRGARQFVHYYMRTDILNSLSHPIVWCIYEDKKDNLWIGTHGGGMNMLNRKTGRYTYFTHDADNPNSISNNVVRNIIEDKNGYLWIGTNGGGLNRSTGKPGSLKHISTIRKILPAWLATKYERYLSTDPEPSGSEHTAAGSINSITAPKCSLITGTIRRIPIV